jgi:NAD-dependent dihydropyrimidine dehydrogenase PreA subunit
MIEIIVESRCVGCDICAKICPTNVFDYGQGGVPTIARQVDCQTCFLCEAYCPADALYVAPESDRHVEINEAELLESGKLGRYRRILGWGPGRKNNSDEDNGYLLKYLPEFRRLAPVPPKPENEKADPIGNKSR